MLGRIYEYVDPSRECVGPGRDARGHRHIRRSSDVSDAGAVCETQQPALQCLAGGHHFNFLSTARS